MTSESGQRCEPDRLGQGRVAASWLCCLLFAHALLLAFAALRDSPTLNEPGHLAAGLSYWMSGRFHIYNVNPPLIRLLAAAPLVLSGQIDDPATVSNGPGDRPEALMGRRLAARFGEDFFWIVTTARLACLPLSLLGGYICYRWASELYGRRSGFVALIAWLFSPEVLAHGHLITCDMGAAALGVTASYAFWRWLRMPTFGSALAVGLLLGLAELTKSTWLLLPIIWPLIWLASRFGTPLTWRAVLRQVTQLMIALSIALYVINLGYGFEGSGRLLKDYTFVSQTLTGASEPSKFQRGNRFTSSIIGNLPDPLPANYLLGMDFQKRDFEQFFWPSYMRGAFSSQGWWHYYLYAATIKLPLGTWALFAVACLRTAIPKGFRREELALTIPPLAVFLLVSSQTGFSQHFRYILPALPFLFIFISKSFVGVGRTAQVGLGAMLTWSVLSSLLIYPHSLSYFNEVCGGPLNGHKHLLNSNIDWGQDLLYMKRWLDSNPHARPLKFAYDGQVDPRLAGIEYSLPTIDTELPPGRLLEPGWYALSVNLIAGYPSHAPDGSGSQRLIRAGEYGYFQCLRPVATAGYSIYIYRVESGQRACMDVSDHRGIAPSF